MSLIARNTGGDYTPAPAGTHIARCYQVIDLGTQTTPFTDEKTGMPKEQHQVYIGWELPNELMEDGRPFTIGKFYTLSLHEKATLRSHLEAWRGRPFTDAELDGFHLKNILGVPCLLNVIHDMKQGGAVQAKVGGVMALTRGTTVPDQFNSSVMFDIDEWNQPTFDSLPEFQQRYIKQSHEYAAKFGSNGTVKSNAVAASQHPPLSDDDIPF